MPRETKTRLTGIRLNDGARNRFLGCASIVCCSLYVLASHSYYDHSLFILYNEKGIATFFTFSSPSTEPVISILFSVSMATDLMRD